MFMYIYKVSMVFLTLHLKKVRLEGLSDLSRVPSQGSGASAFTGHAMQMPWLIAAATTLLFRCHCLRVEAWV